VAGRSLHVFLILFALFGLFMLGLGVCVQEDAFISFRYASNLIQGHGLVYNVGERVEGYTNFLWTLILAGGMALGADPVPLSRFLGIGFALVLLLTVFVVARRRDRGHGVTGGLVGTSLIACSPYIATEGVQGLETVMFACLVSWGVLLGVRARVLEATGRPGAPVAHVLSTLTLVVSALTRPEGIGVFGLLNVGGALWNRAHGRRFIGRHELRMVALFAALYLPYWLWRFDYYGYPLPNTFYAKTGGGLAHLVRGLRYEARYVLLNPVVALLSVWGLAGLSTSWGGLRRSGDASRGAFGTISLVVVVGYLLYVASVGGDFKSTFRFLIPVMPLWALLLDGFVSRRLAHGRVSQEASHRRAVAWTLAAIALNTLVVLPRTLEWVGERAWDLKRRTAAGSMLAEYARAGDTLAIHSAGIIPYYSGLYTIDMWGLNDLHIGHRKMPDMGRSHLIGHEKSDPGYVFDRRPTYYIDEGSFLSDEPIADLTRRLEPALPEGEVARSYAVRNAELLLENGHGPRRHWFNYLEIARQEFAR
jgi:hypothetical protein